MAGVVGMEGVEPSSLWPALGLPNWGPFQPLCVQQHPGCWRGGLVCEQVLVLQGCWSHMSILCYKTPCVGGGFLGTRCRKGKRYLIQSRLWISGIRLGLSWKHVGTSEMGSKQIAFWRINQQGLNQKEKAGVTTVFCHWEEFLPPCLYMHRRNNTPHSITGRW